MLFIFLHYEFIFDDFDLKVQRVELKSDENNLEGRGANKQRIDGLTTSRYVYGLIEGQTDFH